MVELPSWATGTCIAHDPPHPACHKCNKEIVRLKSMLDIRTHALRQTIHAAEESRVPLTSDIDRWQNAIMWTPD